MEQRFTITHNGQNYDFVYEPERDGLVWLINKEGGIESKQNFGQVKPALDLEHAKNIAKQMLTGMGF